MMRRAASFLLLVLVLVPASASYAADRIGLGVKAGTLGYGLDVTGRIVDWVSIRGTANAANVSATYSDTDVDYDGKFKLGGAGVLVDFHPFKGKFRVSAGLLRNRNKITLDANANHNVEIGDNTYTPAEVGTVTGTARFKRTVPYVGIGFGSAASGSSRVKFLCDLGVTRQGSARVDVSSRGGLVSASDLEEEESDIEDKVKKYRYWPVIALGVSFRIW